MLISRPTTSLEVPFSTPSSDGGGLRLEEDSSRHIPPVRSGPSLGVYAALSRYVKLYPQRTQDVIVRAATGKVVFSGNSYDTDVTTVVMLSPTQLYSQLPVGAINVKLDTIGDIMDANGTKLSAGTVGVWYDSNSRMVKASKPCFAVVKVTYDEGYSLYTYTFEGACGSVSTGTNTFEDGVVYAIDKSSGGSANLTMEPPECLWPNFVEGDKDRYDTNPVDISLEQDPDFEPCFRVIAGQIQAFAQLRIYPANGVYTLRATNAVTALYSETYTEMVDDAMLINNSSSGSLSRPPYAGVDVLTTLIAPSARGFGGVKGPGNMVTEVDYNSDGSYSNPRTRIVAPMELVATDAYGHVNNVTVAVNAKYSTSYKKILIQFTPVWLTSKGPTFFDSWVFAQRSTGQMANLRVTAPTLQSQSKDKSKGTGNK